MLALAWRLGDDFFSASDLGRPVSRQITHQLRSIVTPGGSWSKVPTASTIDLRDKARMALGGPSFNGEVAQFDGQTRLDKIDEDVMSPNLIDWCLVGRRICASCARCEQPDGTFARGMRGLWAKLRSKDYSRFGSVQNFVDSVVRRTDLRTLIWIGQRYVPC
jgi:hypothetical protein